MVTTDLTDGKRWATDWLFRRTLQDLNDLLDLTLGEDGYERLKAARLAVLVEASRYKLMTEDEKDEQRRRFAYGNVALSNPAVTREDIDQAADELQEQVLDWDYALEARPISKGATPKMDVQLPGPVFDRYYREPDDDDDTSPAIPTPTAEGPVSKPPIRCAGCRGKRIIEKSSPGITEYKICTICNSWGIEEGEPVLTATGARIMEEAAIPPTTSESSFGDWLTPEDEEAYTDLQKDDIVERQSRIAREGSVKYAPALAELAKPTLDFTGRWKTREGGIADVGAQNRDDWNEEGRHRHDTNLDLMERLRDGGNRSF